MTTPVKCWTPLVAHKNATASQEIAEGFFRRFAAPRGIGLFSVLAVILAGNHAVADSPDAAEALSEQLNQIRSFSAKFDQRVEAENGQVLEASEGVLHLRTPDSFFWQTFDPFPLIVYTDDSSVYVYEQDLAQVTVRDLKEVLNSTPAGVILTGGDHLDKQFDVVATPGQEGNVQEYSLFPTAENAEFLRIDLIFDQSALKGLTVEDILGNTSHIHFSDRLLNEPIQDKRFEVTYPQGVDWVRQ